MRVQRIPNPLPAALAVFGALVALREGLVAFGAFAAILIVLLAAGTFLHGAGALGGGDVKLIAAVCATLGVHDGAIFLVSTVLAGGVLGLAVATLQGRLRESLANISAVALPLAAGVRPAPIQSSTKMPYALAIACGALTITILVVHQQ